MNRLDIKSRVATLIVALWLSLNCGCLASVNQELSNEYLMNQFDWTLYLDVRDMPAYLNYRGTSLNPLTRVRIYFRKMTRSANGGSGESIKLYQDLWYYRGQIIGLKRQMPLQLGSNESGCIMVGPTISGAYATPAASDSIVRLIASLYLKSAVASSVFVPSEHYDAFISSLGRYNFAPQMNTREGLQMSLHLQAYPNGSDEFLYLRK
jgi:hypothetical protein